MNLIFTSLAENLGFSLDFIIWFTLSVGLIIFLAKDFKLGILVSFIIEGILFIWFYALYEAGQDWNFYLPLMSFFILLIVLALSLLFVGGVTRERGVI